MDNHSIEITNGGTGLVAQSAGSPFFSDQCEAHVVPHTPDAYCECTHGSGAWFQKIPAYQTTWGDDLWGFFIVSSWILLCAAVMAAFYKAFIEPREMIEHLENRVRFVSEKCDKRGKLKPKRKKPGEITQYHSDKE